MSTPLLESTDDVWDNSPEGIADWLNWYDSLEPLIFTPEEEADTLAWLKIINKRSDVTQDDSIKDVFR